MNFKLNFWQTLALFLPFILGFIILDLPHSNLYSYQTNFAIANFLTVINVFILIYYQTHLVLTFNSRLAIQSDIIKWNSYISSLFITLYLIYVVYLTFVGHSFHNPKYIPGPIRKVDFTIASWFIALFLMHAFITFYFVNNRFIAKRTQITQDVVEKEQLKSDFLIPMKRLIKISIWVFAVMIVLSTITDIFKFHKML